MVLCFSALAMHVWSQGEISRGGWGLRGKPNIPIKLLLEAYTPLSMFCIIQVNLTLAAACLTPVLRFAFSIIATLKPCLPLPCITNAFNGKLYLDMSSIGLLAGSVQAMNNDKTGYSTKYNIGVLENH